MAGTGRHIAASDGAIPVTGGRDQIEGLEKKEMVKELEVKEANLLVEEMTGQDMTMKLVELITEHRYDEGKIREVLMHAVKVFSRRRERE